MLRDDPSPQGKVAMELKIAPGGQVGAEDLEDKRLARMRPFGSGARDVDAMAVTWPVACLPSQGRPTPPDRVGA